MEKEDSKLRNRTFSPYPVHFIRGFVNVGGEDSTCWRQSHDVGMTGT